MGALLDRVPFAKFPKPTRTQGINYLGLITSGMAT
jgi:hypothetical protein